LKLILRGTRIKNVLGSSPKAADLPESQRLAKALKKLKLFFLFFLLFLGDSMVLSSKKMLSKFSHLCQTTNGWSKHQKTKFFLMNFFAKLKLLIMKKCWGPAHAE
jgi:hypothetical protein